MIKIPKFKDISGQKFGRLTALHRLYNLKGHTKWLCVCECGNLAEVFITNLTSGDTNSCGCLQKESVVERFTKHGKRYTRLYRILNGMKNRCYNKTVPQYPNYGGRGIKVCDEWLNDFEAFYTWSKDNGYSDNLSIDRIDVNGNYEPNNCRWVTQKQQMRNTRVNKCFTYKGETHCLKEWCEILGLNYNTVTTHISRNWTINEALGLKGDVKFGC